FDTNIAGEQKAELAEERLPGFTPEIELEALTEEDLEEYVPEVDLVLDCSDNLETRKAVNRVCVTQRIPLLSAAAIRWKGHFDFFSPFF
ncbi:MAG: sulfur carrier protein ThiS adenylyltransferase, partial [Porticoccus sp.]